MSELPIRRPANDFNASNPVEALERAFDAREARVAANGAIGSDPAHAVTYAMQGSDDPHAPLHTVDGGPGYAVYRNDDWTELEKLVAAIEDTDGALSTGTGRSAINLVMTLLPAGSHIIITPPDAYPGTRKLFTLLGKLTGLEVDYVESTPEALAAAYRPGQTKMIFFEPETNPLMKTADFDAILGLAKQHPEVITVADNTATPLIVQPLTYRGQPAATGEEPPYHGVDLVMHSLTKFISGSNHTQGGAVAVNRNRPDLLAELRNNRDITGPIIDAEVAATLAEQIEHFSHRMELHCRNAQLVAEWLERQPEIAQVHFPGLPSDSGHALAQKQFTGFNGHVGGMFSFELDGDVKDAKVFSDFFMAEPNSRSEIRASESTLVADSFGARVTLLNWYSHQSKFFGDKSPEEQALYGMNDVFFRLALGRGKPEDIIRDLGHGLDAVVTARLARNKDFIASQTLAVCAL